MRRLLASAYALLALGLGLVLYGQPSHALFMDTPTKGATGGGGGPAGPWTFISHGTMNPTSVPPEAPIGGTDCHLATAAFVVISRYTGSGTLAAPADSSGNTYTQIGTEAVSSTQTGTSLWWFHGTTANFSSSFFWGEGSGTPAFFTLNGACFTDGTSPSSIDGSPTQANSANQPGAIMPSGTNRLLITGYVAGDASAGVPAVNSGFTITDSTAFSSGQWEGGGMAYLIQTTATTENPTWSTTGGVVGAAIMAAFK